MLRTVVLIGLMAFSPLLTQAQALSVSGMPRVLDGDTLRLETVRIRLVGIDAPETAQTCLQDGQSIPCGTIASATLRALISSSITCTLEGRDKYDRLLGRCTAGGIDLNREMVRSGWAVAYWSQEYRRDEAEARAARRGLWGTVFQQPSAYRKEAR